MTEPDCRLLEIIVCPKCRGTVNYDTEKEKIICESCRIKFEILDGIPIMLLDEAESY
jgi:hypothetical protein